MSYPSYLILFFILLIVVIPFSACSNNHDYGFVADGYIIFDYTSNSSKPTEKMSVFITADKNFPVVKMKISTEHKGDSSGLYEWTSKKIYAMNNTYWCQNLSVPDTSNFPIGKYVVTTVFADGSEQSASFTLQYPSYCVSNDMNNVKKLLNKDFRPISEVYDKTKIKNVNSAIEKICYINNNKHVLCILPESNNKGL